MSNVVEMEPKTTEEIAAEKAVKNLAEEKKAAKEKKISKLLKGYEMRELTGEDIFKVFEIAEALNVADLIVEFFESKDAATIQAQKVSGLAVVAHKSEDDSQIKKLTAEIADIQTALSKSSFDVIGKATKFLLANLNTVKSQINSLLADLTDKEEQEIAKTNIVVYTLLLKSFFTKPELSELFELLG